MILIFVIRRCLSRWGLPSFHIFYIPILCGRLLMGTVPERRDDFVQIQCFLYSDLLYMDQ